MTLLEQCTKQLFTTDIDTLTELSLISLLIVFICRLLIKDLGFEHLKIMAIVIIFTYTLEFSIVQYKTEQNINLTNHIINIKTSSLPQNEKEQYIVQFNSDKTTLDSLDTSNFIFTMSKIILLLLIILTIVDTLKILNEKYRFVAYK